jgi:DNA-binding NarL/FixJ family response regulator
MEPIVAYLTLRTTFRRSRLHSARWVVLYAQHLSPSVLWEAVEDAGAQLLLLDAELLQPRHFAKVEQVLLQPRSIVVVAPRADADLLAAVLQTRAMGTLCRSDSNAVWDDTVQRVLDGEAVFPGWLCEALCMELMSRLGPEGAGVPRVHLSWPTHSVCVH